MQGALVMTAADRERYRNAKDVMEGLKTLQEAGRQVGVRARQMQRIVARVRQAGAGGVQHGLRGRPSNHRLAAEQREQIARLIGEQYEDYGPTLAQEKLAERHGIAVGVSTVRSVMIEHKLWQPGRRGRRHRAWRERRRCVGQMIQVDGSYHDWFEGRRGKAVLLAFIDDASSRVMYAVFVEAETTVALMQSAWAYVVRYGLPDSLYVDRDSIYAVNRQAAVEEQLRDAQPQTQFDRAMEELGVTMILARSPQAKGRVERLFKTLQDRLVKELRLRGLSTLTIANQYLEQDYLAAHNARFAVEPAQEQDTHRRVPAGVRLEEVFSMRETRVVLNDYTVRYRNRRYQIGKQQAVRVAPKHSVMVEERLDGSVHLRHRGVLLQASDITDRQRPKACVVRRRKLAHVPARIERWKPAPDHPWRHGWGAAAAAPREEASLATLTALPRANKEVKACHF